MNNQTENYIVLKPIAERFNEVSKTISDEDIKYIIKSTIKEQLINAFDFSNVGNIVEDYIENNQEDINKMILESIKERMKMSVR